MKEKPKNMAASVKARLLALARQKTDESFQQLMVRFGVERLLYRLSQSSHSEKFLLKGAMLFAVWDKHLHRTTQDIDFLSFGPSEMEDIAGVFREVARTPVPDDGLVFDAESLRTHEIREDQIYRGVRVRMDAWLAKAEVPIQIDVATGDAVTPGPDDAFFPTLLDFPAPRIRTYPIYTVVAEKFEAMVKLELDNTRMKDFYDLWFLTHRFEFDGPILREAILATFSRRGTSISAVPFPLTAAFAADPTLQSLWEAFIRRSRLMGAPPRLVDVMERLRQFLGPPACQAMEDRSWQPAAGWLDRPPRPTN